MNGETSLLLTENASEMLTFNMEIQQTVFVVMSVNDFVMSV